MGIPDYEKVKNESLTNIFNILESEGFKYELIEGNKKQNIFKKVKKFIYAFCVPQPKQGSEATDVEV